MSEACQTTEDLRLTADAAGAAAAATAHTAARPAAGPAAAGPARPAAGLAPLSALRVRPHISPWNFHCPSTWASAPACHPCPTRSRPARPWPVYQTAAWGCCTRWGCSSLLVPPSQVSWKSHARLVSTVPPPPQVGPGRPAGVLPGLPSIRRRPATAAAAGRRPRPPVPGPKCFLSLRNTAGVVFALAS